MDAGRLLKSARLHAGLTQRELAARARVPQPMISSIERGLQDPRHATLTRLLRECAADLDLVALAGVGVDRTQFVASLKLTPTERMRSAIAALRGVGRLRKARRVS